MKALHITAPRSLTYTEVAAPEPGPDALVAIEQVGICGTDAKIFRGDVPVDYPRIMGHEMIGRIAAEGGRRLHKVDQRVLIDPGVACGVCPNCGAGRFNLCLRGGLLGRDEDGVWAEFATAPDSRLIPVPDSITQRAGGLLQVLGTCVHAQRQARVFPGDVAVVLGLGVSGLLFTQLLSLAGATVVGITRSAWKRELAQELGAHGTAEPGEAEEAVSALTGGLGADLVIEAVGTEATLASAVQLARVGGQLVVFGTLTGGGAGLPYYQLYFKELVVHNPRAALPTDYHRGIDLAASGALDLEPIVTDVLPLEEADRAFDLLAAGSSLKILMTVQ